MNKQKYLEPGDVVFYAPGFEPIRSMSPDHQRGVIVRVTESAVFVRFFNPDGSYCTETKAVDKSRLYE